MKKKKIYKILTVVTIVVTLVSIFATQCFAARYTGDYGEYYVPDELYGEYVGFNDSLDFLEDGMPLDYLYRYNFYTGHQDSFSTFYFSPLSNASGSNDYVTLHNSFLNNYENFEYAQSSDSRNCDFSSFNPGFRISVPLFYPYIFKLEFDISSYGVDIPDFQFRLGDYVFFDSSVQGISGFCKTVGSVNLYDSSVGGTSSHDTVLFSMHAEVTLSSDGSINAVLTTPHSEVSRYCISASGPSTSYGSNLDILLIGETGCWSYFGIGDTQKCYNSGFTFADELPADISDYNFLSSYCDVKISSFVNDPEKREALFNSTLNEILTGETTELKEKASDYDSVVNERDQYLVLSDEYYYQIQDLNAEIAILEAEIASLNNQIAHYQNQEDVYVLEIDKLEKQIEEKNTEVSSLNSEIDDLRSKIDYYDTVILDLQGENEYLSALNFELENSNALDEIFTGASDGFLSIIRGVADLGYTTSGGVSVTVGGLLTVAVLGAFIIFILRLVMGGGGK